MFRFALQIETWSHIMTSVRIVPPSASLREAAAVTYATERPFGSLVHRVIRFANNATPRVGLEPTTPRLTAACSTIELSRKIVLRYNKSIVPSKLHTNSHKLNLRIKPIIRSFRKSPRPISTHPLHMLPCFHSVPINLVVFKGS